MRIPSLSQRDRPLVTRHSSVLGEPPRSMLYRRDRVIEGLYSLQFKNERGVVAALGVLLAVVRYVGCLSALHLQERSVGRRGY